MGFFVWAACEKHPKYQAAKRPVSDCALCRAIWHVTRAAQGKEA